MRPSSPVKLKTLPALLAVLSGERKAGKKVVFTNGCFDVLHVGHVRYLRAARRLGDRLVVGLNSDASVRALKGAGRPVTHEKDRAEIVGSLESVDDVVLFSAPTPEGLIRAIRPDFLVKGGDWKTADIAGGPFVESYGGRTVSLAFYKGFSTTRLIEKIKKL
ncbi:MAG: D-glycero-beta-D-manno-heptose 1-phosphate adenylyltransferase [Candidatus Omnitrophica bacterium]|nr:D-glycero-beta-D-manno-heptose 1-phosphate adenylyltransferase [Candidatus Omnitrophota bacterium]